MGAVTFSLDIQLITLLKSTLPLSSFIETGTFKGDTIASVLPFFDELISVELSELLHQQVAKRYEKESKVTLHQGDSAVLLSQIAPIHRDKSTLYWLDAHWCMAQNTAGEISQCPLLQEIQSIGYLNEQSVILIDDARLFLSPPPKPHEVSQWPSFNNIILALSVLSQTHMIMVINDVIAFYPPSAHSVMNRYAIENGVDWLQAMHALMERPNLLINLENSQRQLNDQFKILNFRFVRTLYRISNKVIKIISPRMGVLNQHLPRSLTQVSLYQSKRTTVPLKISIVTPSFGQGYYIESTIQSVLNQNYANLEYFVQDGGSKDKTVSILKRYEDKLSGWVSEPDEGQAHAINLGFAKTSGDIMGWLNSDDLLLPGTLDRVSDYFMSHPKVDVLYGDRLLIDENGMEIGRWLLPKHNNKILSWVDYIPQETLFWRRRAWDAVKQLDESYQFAMDWDLLVRFRNAGMKFAHLPHFLGAFRVHPAQKTTASINEIGFAEMNRIREKIHGYVPSAQKIRKAAVPYLLHHLVVEWVYQIKKRCAKYRVFLKGAD